MLRSDTELVEVPNFASGVINKDIGSNRTCTCTLLQAVVFRPQVLGLVVLHVLGLRLRVLPLLGRPLTVLRLLVLWLLELRGPGL